MIRLEKDTITPSIKQMKKALAQLPKQAYQEWVRDTPVVTGNARRNTRLVNTTIQADYPYAQKLDSGSSRQAPKGMSVPVKKFVEEQMQKIMRL